MTFLQTPQIDKLLKKDNLPMGTPPGGYPLLKPRTPGKEDKRASTLTTTFEAVSDLMRGDPWSSRSHEERIRTTSNTRPIRDDFANNRGPESEGPGRQYPATATCITWQLSMNTIQSNWPASLGNCRNEERNSAKFASQYYPS